MHHLSLLWQAFMTCCVNKATPIHFIDSKCHIKQLKAEKSHKTCLTNHTQSISHRITPLVCNAFRGGHTNTSIHTDMRTKAILRNQVCGACGLHMPSLKIFVLAGCRQNCTRYIFTV